jgi:hypothetical protein
MTHRDVYLGDPNDPNFELVGKDWAGNFPTRLGPAWPRQKQGESFTEWGVYSEIVARAMSKHYEGCMTDWGCWVTPMTPNELLEFIDQCYGDGPVYPPEWTIRGENPEDHEIRAFVRQLDPNQKYYLVALES